MKLLKIIEAIIPREDEPFFGIKNATIEYAIWAALLVGIPAAAIGLEIRDKIAENRAEEQLKKMHCHRYEVQRGDSLYKIARKNLEDYEEVPTRKIIEYIKEENGIDNSNVIRRGEFIYLPCNRKDKH